MPPPLTDDVVALSRKGVAVIVGTRDAALVPAVTRGWGLWLAPERGEALVCVSVSTGGTTLANAAENGQIAVTFSLPSTYRTFQIKGRVIEVAAPSADDRRRVEAHVAAFLNEAASVALPRDLGRRLFTRDDGADPGLRQLRVHVEAVFDQTPGPSAGARL